MRRVTAHGSWLLAALGAAAVCVALMAPVRGGTAGPREAAGPAAQWRPFDLYVELNDLPRAYTCNELWYRFHDLLLAIGARPNPQIVAYHCDATAAESSHSPSVQLQFQLPDLLPPSLSRYADVAVERSTIRLGPGKLPSFTTQDCELLKQMNAKLLAALPVRVVGTLKCPAPAASKQRFALEVQALLPNS
ncbi:MAG: hypothetical protein ACLPTM_11990 [Steroidobacteraceae bacterium]